MRCFLTVACLLLLSASSWAASFEGKWTPLELPPLAASVVMEFNKDGNFSIAMKNQRDCKVDTMTGKWVKTGEKIIEYRFDVQRDKANTAVMLEDDLIELSNFNGTTKHKFKRMK